MYLKNSSCIQTSYIQKIIISVCSFKLNLKVNMKTHLVKIGNSQGIKIPSSLVQQCNLEGEILIEVINDEILIKGSKNSRNGWNEVFKKANSKKENSLIEGDGMNISDWDIKEWKW